jgi:hypothetical protein
MDTNAINLMLIILNRQNNVSTKPMTKIAISPSPENSLGSSTDNLKSKPTPEDQHLKFA